MNQRSTSDTLLLHLFNELESCERQAFEHVLISDAHLQEEYRQTAALIEHLVVPFPEEAEAFLDRLYR